MKIRKIDHISLAVRNLEKARQAYEDVLGLELHSTYVSEEEKIRVARYRVGNMWLELMEPTGEGDVSRFLDKRGEGLFVISYEVPDVDAALAELKDKGYKPIDDKPRHLLGSRYAFINRPKELSGILSEVLDYREKE